MHNNREKSSSTGPSGRDELLFKTMAKDLHVDLAKVAERENGEAIARAQTRCADCGVAQECEDWLDASFGVPLPPAFCPNAPFFHLCIAAAHDETD